MTARLDTIQAAILSEKLKIFDDEIAARETIARRYNDALRDIVTVPHVSDGNTSVWAQYTIQLPEEVDRQHVIAALKAAGIPIMVYYETPMHRQTAYRNFPALEQGLPVSERLSGRVVSLPMHPYLDKTTQDRIVDAVRGAVRA
jgi:dTDP-4-amino-4,6-dideoxygalactose transaminase